MVEAPTTTASATTITGMNPRKRRRRRVRLEDFLSLEDAHPYGCLPGGNRFLGIADASDQRSASKVFAADTNKPRKMAFPQLSDAIWQQILSFCDAPSLATVARASRRFYVATHQPELWRDLVLRRAHVEQRVIDKASGSWRETYFLLFGGGDRKPHKPIQVAGIYSDEYYRTHRCRSFAIPEVWLSEEEPSAEGHVVAVDLLTPEAFLERFEAANTPALVKGAAAGSAQHRWADPSYLRDHSHQPGRSFRTTSGAAPLPANFTLKAYEGYSGFSYLEESPLYLFDRTAFDDHEQWKKDFFPGFYKKCPWWDPDGPHGHDLLQHLGANERPDHTWLVSGPKRSGSVFHIDPNATHAWNACLVGRKRWIFYPPGTNPPGVFPSEDGDEVALPLSVGEWLLQYWPEHLDRSRTASPAQRPMEFTAHPGDVVFVPHGWWHSVINLDTANLAITHNYASPSNLGNVLRFFERKQDQISGCRDREETIKPENLRDALVNALAGRPEEKEHLATAEQQVGWTCAAWKDDDPIGANSCTDFHVGGGMQKRPRSDGDPMEPIPKKSSGSVMDKTERLSAFTFSFL